MKIYVATGQNVKKFKNGKSNNILFGAVDTLNINGVRSCFFGNRGLIVRKDYYDHGGFFNEEIILGKVEVFDVKDLEVVLNLISDFEIEEKERFPDWVNFERYTFLDTREFLEN